MKPLLVALAGPSGAGKSTLAKAVAEKNTDISVIRFDDFLKDADQMPKFDRWLNWETPEALHLDQFISVIRSVKEGTTVSLPEYSRKEIKRKGAKEFVPTRIVLVEGYMPFHNEELAQLFDIRIFIKISMDECLKRRVVRQPDLDFEYWKKVVLLMWNIHGAAQENFATHTIAGELNVDEKAREILRILKTK